MKKIGLIAILFSVFLVTATIAHADPYHHRHYYHRHPAVETDYGPLVPGGHWIHGWHQGRDAWWWVLGSTWVLRPAPVVTYGYPGYPSPLYGYPANRPGNIAYYCPHPRGYYPTVGVCARPWDQVIVP